jgi:hypothetical protein
MPRLKSAWSEAKNDWLKVNRGLSFEAVAHAIENGLIVDDIDHPSRPNQRVLIVELENYLCAVPYVTDGDVKFLKTIYRNRRLAEKYGGEHDET